MAFDTRPPVGPVQVLPPGLLNMLQLKSGGQSPDSMRQDIQPNIDMEAWWLRATKKNWPGAFGQTVPAGTVNDVAGLLGAGLTQAQPGPRAWWYIHELSVRARTAVSATTNLMLAVRQPGGGQGSSSNDSFFMHEPFLPSLGIGETWIWTARGFWMPPGSTFGVYLGTVGAGGEVVLDLLGVSYSECPL